MVDLAKKFNPLDPQPHETILYTDWLTKLSTSSARPKRSRRSKGRGKTASVRKKEQQVSGAEDITF